MSKYVRYYNGKKSMYRDFAASWAGWAEGVQLSSMEKEGMSKFFSSIAKRFGLIKELTELGVIG